MNKTIFVISDLHLGGAAIDPSDPYKPTFQMCSLQGRQKLVEFIEWIATKQSNKNKIHLVLAGDIVDFLAEEPFEAFTNSDSAACIKLQNIFKTTHNVWEALSRYIQQGNLLTLMLGNHDVELSLPGPRTLLLERLGSGNIEFIYDNQAFTTGSLLIEHGNRYDGANIINHTALRQIRSSLSRKENPNITLSTPGSLLVANVMNGLKKKYPFVDLLKPETEAVIPLLIVLEPSVLQYLPESMYRAKIQPSMVRYDKKRRPKNPSLISDIAFEPKRGKLIQELLSDGSQISATSTLKGLRDLFGAVLSVRKKEKHIDRLYKALRAFVEDQHLYFDSTTESEEYLKAAKALTNNGFKVVVFGHTHFAKNVKLDNQAIYLNSGTWADLMQLPDSLLKGEETIAKAELEDFIQDLKSNNLKDWRKQKPTFAQIDFIDSEITTADVFVFNAPNNIVSISKIRESRNE